MRIALVCGGPSAERGISLNSARSVMDHLSPLGWEIMPLYCDMKKNFYRLSPSQLYSNTPSDFDFKLKHNATPLSEAKFIAACRANDIVFPAIHGAFGEDGDLQELLEKHNIPFVGSPSVACRLMFDKAIANLHMAQHGFATLPNTRVGEQGIRFLLVSGKPIEEPVAWYGPIVMNTQEELRKAVAELNNGTFIK